jgi:hypothetical protein
MRILSILFFLSILGTTLGRFKGGKAIRKIREAYDQQSIYRKENCYRNTRYLLSTPDLNPAFESYDYKNLGKVCLKEKLYDEYSGCIQEIENERITNEWYAGGTMGGIFLTWLYYMVTVVIR